MDGKQPSMVRHARDCRICRHPQREAIENAFVSWESPSQIAKTFSIHRSTIYLHAAATETPRPCGFTEYDPIARSFVRHPSLAYATAYGSAFAAARLGNHWRHSRRALLRNAWWVPQALSLAANAYGFASSSHH
jgi:hypothetical protein